MDYKSNAWDYGIIKLKNDYENIGNNIPNFNMQIGHIPHAQLLHQGQQLPLPSCTYQPYSRSQSTPAIGMITTILTSETGTTCRGITPTSMIISPHSKIAYLIMETVTFINNKLLAYKVQSRYCRINIRICQMSRGGFGKLSTISKTGMSSWRGGSANQALIFKTKLKIKQITKLTN